MAKFDREVLAHYLDSKFGASGSPVWARLGKDLEELNIDLAPDTETRKNILGEQSVRDNGYEVSASVDTYYADPADPMYEKIKDIAFNRLKGDDCKTKYLEVIIDPSKVGGSYEAWIEDVVIKPQSIGGDTSGVQIPYNILFDGNRKKGTVTIEDGVPTFVEG